ncbi:TonB-dependent receptor [Aegicerativicinus sediminis]|uniref:TonB-dependent receptor n=1 Tax=Aegicerativicinus sediminis TaxID=2893202 RepID=UPI001E318B8D|nr:TonB-dependent receptor [Aegicerativicinus sediminis]
MRLIYIIIFTLISFNSFSQLSMQGVVKDSLGNPLELANVIAINESTEALESYAITNEDGRYKLALSKNSSYNIQVSYIGMKTHTEKVSTIEESLTKDFTLQVDNSLDEVELTYEMPVSVKGDTLIYNADSFKNGTERKLEDVLKKLPGVEVNDEGQIEVEGRAVTKVMVDGKDFFDGDSKLATKNIPSNAVDKVQVLKNFAEVGQLSGVTENRDNVAINIKLKKGKESFWFGNVTAGAGAANSDDLYLIQPKLFYYNPKYSINFIGDMNNLGEVAFTRRDYFNFTGGFRMPSRQSGTNINLGNNNLGFLTLQNNRAKAIETKFGAANFSYSPTSTLDISGFAIFSNSQTELEENNSITYTDPGLQIPDETTNSNTIQNSDLGMLKLSAKYKPNGNNQLDYDVVGRVSRESQNRGVLSSILGNTDQIEETDPYSINQNLNYYYTLNEKNIFALEAQHLIQDEDPFYNAILESTQDYENVANALGLDPNQTGYNIAQDKRVKSNQLDAKLDYYYVLNQKSNLNFTAGSILSRQQFNSTIFQFLDDGSVYNPDPLINDGLNENDIDYRFSDIYIGTHYRFKTGMFTFNPGISAHAYSTKNEQYGEAYQDNFFRILPDIDIRMEVKKSEQIAFSYAMQNQFTDVTNLARGLVLNNYNSISYGNPTLENAVSHNVNLFYNSFNMFNYTNVFGRLNYSKRIDQIRNLTDFESVVRLNSPFNSGFADETFSASGRYQRTFKKIRAQVNGNFNYSKFNQFVQGNRTLNESYTQTYGAQLRTNYRDAPNVEISYSYTIQDNDQGSRRTKFYTSAPSIEFDAYIWKKLTFRTDYTYNNFSDENGTLRSFQFWNASLSYRNNQDAKFEYILNATNLLDTRSQANSNVGNISVSATEYYIQPRYITFRLRYEI